MTEIGYFSNFSGDFSKKRRRVTQVLDECAHALRVLDPSTYGPRRNVATSEVSGYLPK